MVPGHGTTMRHHVGRNVFKNGDRQDRGGSRLYLNLISMDQDSWKIALIPPKGHTLVTRLLSTGPTYQRFCHFPASPWVTGFPTNKLWEATLSCISVVAGSYRSVSRYFQALVAAGRGFGKLWTVTMTLCPRSRKSLSITVLEDSAAVLSLLGGLVERSLRNFATADKEGGPGQPVAPY